MLASPVFHGTAAMRIFKEAFLDELGVGGILGVGHSSIFDTGAEDAPFRRDAILSAWKYYKNSNIEALYCTGNKFVL